MRRAVCDRESLCGSFRARYRHRRELCHEVAEGAGVHSYAIHQMFIPMINRCQQLKLRLHLSEANTRQKLLILLTVQTMNGIHSGYHRIAL